MIDWDQSRYFPCRPSDPEGVWRIVHGSIEILVAGTPEGPSPHWIAHANDVINSIDRHCITAMKYLDAFVDRERIAAGSTWIIMSAEFGPIELGQANARFVLNFQLDRDEYGLWSVAFQSTGLPEPRDVAPSRIQRQQI